MTLAKDHARYLGSMFVTVFTSQATMMVDAAVGGNLLGTEAVSAVELVMPLYELFYALVMMLAMGACTVSSMCLGRGDVAAVHRHFAAAVTSSLLMMVLLGIGILLFQDGIVGLLCGESYLFGYTRAYLVAMVPFFVLAGLSVISMLFTSMAGRPGLIMLCSIVQFCVNVSCNLLLIKIVGLGIEALAYSSAFASAVTLALLLPNYLSPDCPFRIVRGSFDGFFRALGVNVRYGSGFFAMSMAYVVMTYAMNALVLRFDGERGLFLWSVVMMIYVTGDYASAAAQETSLVLGGRLLGAGDEVGFRMVYRRSLLFVLGWIGLILFGVFVMPDSVLPLFGVAADAVAGVGEATVVTAVGSAVSARSDILPAVARAVPFIAGVSIGNLMLVRLVQKGLVALYAVLSWLLYLAIPVGYLLMQ